MFSTRTLIEASGVLSSWETLLIKSRLIFSTFFDSVKSCKTIRTPSLMGEVMIFKYFLSLPYLSIISIFSVCFMIVNWVNSSILKSLDTFIRDIPMLISPTIPSIFSASLFIKSTFLLISVTMIPILSLFNNVSNLTFSL